MSECAAQASKRDRSYTIGNDVFDIIYYDDSLSDGLLGQATSGKHSKDPDRHFDPFWLNALSFLKHAFEKKLFRDDLRSCPLGRLVKVSGTLAVSDLEFIRRVVRNPTLRKRMFGSGLERAHAAVSEDGDQVPLDAWRLSSLTALELVSELPSSTSAILYGDEVSWSPMKADCMVLSPVNLLLQHGSVLPGEWQILGLLSAIADEGPCPTQDSFQDGFPFGRQFGVRSMMDELLPIARTQFGRPHDAFGITPLLIFRETNGRSHERRPS